MKVIVLAAISANGMIAQHPDQISTDWTSKEDKSFFVELTKEAGVVVMGRTTFETIGKPLKGRRVIVLSRTPQVSPFEGVEYTQESPQQIIERLKTEGNDKLVVAGGSSVYTQFLHEQLVTDLFLTIEPVLFAKGIPLLNGEDFFQLALLEQKSIGPNAVCLHYRVLY